jgi:type I restriction enzyme S subunit
MLKLIPTDWSIRNIETVLDDVIDYRGKSPPKSEQGIPLITAKNIRKGFINQEPREYIYEDQFDNWMVRGLPKFGDIFITTEAPLGNVARVPSYKFAIGQRVLTLRPKPNLVFSDFLLHVMQGLYFKEQLDLQSTGSTVAGIKQSTFRKIPLPLPPLPEQQKIAKILTSVDEVIEKTQAQIDKLKDLKTAMMQELLTQGVCDENGKRHVEFKDSPVGRIPVGWEVVTLEDIIDRVIDCEHKTAPYVDKSEFLVVRTSNVRNGELIFDDMKYTTEDGFNEWTKRTVPVVGDVLFSREAPAGESCMVPAGLKVCMGQRMVLLRPNKESIDPDFFSFYLSSDFAALAIYERSIGTTVSRINIEDIKRIPCIVPPLKEQQHISKAIQSCQTTISNKELKLSAFIATKKALMQDLLTGKVRVNLDTHHNDQNSSASRTSTHAALAVS